MNWRQTDPTDPSAGWIRPAAALAAAVLGVLALALAAAAQEAAEPEAPAEPPLQEKRDALRGVIQTRLGGNAKGASIQAEIDQVADETDALNAEYRTALKQIEAIQKFNDQMNTLIDSQRSELASVADQLDRVEEVGRNVTPLMLRMIDALEDFVRLDLPFLHGERVQRIADLRSLMDRADISSATKFRQIMEAYQTENEYGRTIEAYRGQVEVNGQQTMADLLRFGRIALAFQSLDGSLTGVWNNETRSWQVLDESFGRSIRSGLRIARKLEPPDLIELPLPPPQDSRVTPEPEVAQVAAGEPTP